MTEPYNLATPQGEEIQLAGVGGEVTLCEMRGVLCPFHIRVDYHRGAYYMDGRLKSVKWEVSSEGGIELHAVVKLHTGKVGRIPLGRVISEGQLAEAIELANGRFPNPAMLGRVEV